MKTKILSQATFRLLVCTVVLSGVGCASHTPSSFGLGNVVQYGAQITAAIPGAAPYTNVVRQTAQMFQQQENQARLEAQRQEQYQMELAAQEKKRQAEIARAEQRRIAEERERIRVANLTPEQKAAEEKQKEEIRAQNAEFWNGLACGLLGGCSSGRSNTASNQEQSKSDRAARDAMDSIRDNNARQEQDRQAQQPTPEPTPYIPGGVGVYSTGEGY